MNPHQYSSPASHGPSESHLHIDSKVPRPPLHHNEPAFMTPLLPPHPPQDVFAASHATFAYPPVQPPASCSTQPPAFPAQLVGAPLHQLQDQAACAPCGSDDSDEEYSLEFPLLDAFHHWRSELEEREIVEFLKADTCRSKNVPPNFNEPTRLTCTRNFKNARNKYVNTLPERNRGVPNRNIEGESCPASISYKTYFGAATVRAKYFYQHSHPIGRENLPFTRRGRKLAEHERRIQHQEGFSRPDAAIPGTAVPNNNGSIASNNRELRNMEALRIEPPPMASLKPPDPAPSYSPGAMEYSQGHHRIGVVQVSPPRSDFSRPPTQNPADISPTVSQPSPTAVYERNYGNDIARLPETASVTVVPPIARSQGRHLAYRAPPPLPPYDPNAQVHQPQPTYLSHTEALNCQAQCLPTPTTPSTQIRNLHAHPNPHVYSEALRRRNPETHDPAAPISIPSGSHVSPISPVTPHTQTLAGPPLVPPATPDGRTAIPMPQYFPRDAPTFDEERWNRLEALFQAVRLRARGYVLPGHTMATLESLLYRLYLESHQLEGDQQLSTYQQQQ